MYQVSTVMVNKRDFIKILVSLAKKPHLPLNNSKTSAWNRVKIEILELSVRSIFLLLNVSISFSSFGLENGKKSLVQYHVDLPCFKTSIHRFVYLSCYISGVPRHHTELNQNYLRRVDNTFYIDKVLPYWIY